MWPLTIFFVMISMLATSFAWPDWKDGDRCKWSDDCDYEGHDLHSRQSRGEECGGICADYINCTHFVWTEWNGGTCWLKRGHDLQPKRSNGYSVCGYVQRKYIVTVCCNGSV